MARDFFLLEMKKKIILNDKLILMERQILKLIMFEDEILFLKISSELYSEFKCLILLHAKRINQIYV